MRRLLIAVGLVLAFAGAAHAFGFGMGNRFGKLGAQSGGGTITPVPKGDILLTDGISFILQTDGSSLICRAGGC